MPCKIQIKQNITTEVENRTASGFNKTLADAQALARRVNDAFKTQVVSFVQKQADYIDRIINIPDVLVDEYYNNELALEQQEARNVQQEDAQRAGEEYTDDYLFYQTSPNQVNYQLKAIEILQSEKAKQIFYKGKNNNWSLDKMLTELQIPKEQKQIILDKNIKEKEVDTYGQTIFNRNGENINKEVIKTLENIVKKEPEKYLVISSDFSNNPDGYIVLHMQKLVESKEIKELYTKSGGFFANKEDIKSNNLAIKDSLLDEFTQHFNIVDDSFILTRPFGFDSEKDMLDYITKNPEKFVKDDLFFKISKGKVGISPLILRNKAKDFIPKELKFVKPNLNIVKSNNLREEIITSLLAENSFVVEVNITKSKLQYIPSYQEYQPSQEEIDEANKDIPDVNTEYYSNLTVPGGTNGSYIEANIETPMIVPSIQSHAQFKTENTIGWMRADEKQNYQEKDIDNLIEIMKKSGILEVNCG